MSHFGDTLLIRKSFYSTISQLAGRSPNFILPIVFLGKFGGSGASDQLFLSWAIVFFLGATLSNAASDAFIPDLSESKINRPSVKWRNSILALSLFSLILVAFLAPEIGFYTLCIAIISMFLVAVALSSAFYVSQSYFYGDFVTPGITWVFRWVSVFPILLVDNVEIAALLFYFSVLVADILRWFVLKKSVARYLPQSSDQSLRIVGVSGAFWFMLSASLSGLNPLVDRFIAGTLVTGSLSQLEVIERIASLFLLVPTIGVMQVINVEVNRKIQSSDFLHFDFMLLKWFFAASLWSVVCISFVIYFGEFVVNLLEISEWLGHQSFIFGVIILISSAPSMFVGMICVRILLGMKKSRVVLVYSGCSLGFNAVVSIVLSSLYGVNGILLGTLLTYSFTGVMLVLHCSRYHRSNLDNILRKI